VASQGGGQIFVFSSLLEMKPPQININISILIKEIQKNFFFARGVPRGGGSKILFIFIVRDKTIKHEY
jgi:hypothetical protein